MFEKYYAASLGRFRVSVTTAPRTLKARDLPAEVEDACAIHAAKRTLAPARGAPAVTGSTSPRSSRPRATRSRTLRKQIPHARDDTGACRSAPPTTRGRRSSTIAASSCSRRRRSSPACPSWLASAAARRSRESARPFARWLVSAENPLTAGSRSTATGRRSSAAGIVRTLDDFGYQGEPPTHPELLDWLARASSSSDGWSVKQLHKLIVMSATYRQSSRVTPELLAKDPDNKLLARGPAGAARGRADSRLRPAGRGTALGEDGRAERLPAAAARRDNRGNLRRPQLEAERRRGSLPRAGSTPSAKRTAPYAMANTFDAPSGEVCLARREVVELRRFRR